jgi:hypothetical protein
MLIRGNSVFTPAFSSSLAPVFTRYVVLKRVLGRRFDGPSLRRYREIALFRSGKAVLYFYGKRLACANRGMQVI